MCINICTQPPLKFYSVFLGYPGRCHCGEMPAATYSSEAGIFDGLLWGLSINSFIVTPTSLPSPLLFILSRSYLPLRNILRTQNFITSNDFGAISASAGILLQCLHLCSESSRHPDVVDFNHQLDSAYAATGIADTCRCPGGSCLHPVPDASCYRKHSTHDLLVLIHKESDFREGIFIALLVSIR